VITVKQRNALNFSLLALLASLFGAVFPWVEAQAIPASEAPSVVEERMAPGDPIAAIVLRGVSPRDVAASPADEFDEAASGLSMVAVGTKVYIEGQPVAGATVSAYQWSLTLRPGNSAAELSSATGQLVTLRPDVRGAYMVQLVPLDGSAAPGPAVTQLIHAGEWVGAGAFDTHALPDPTIPECSNPCCHGDSNNPRLNVVEEWITSGHANKFQKDLSGLGATHYATSCLECHTVGFNPLPSAVNNGFDDIAAAIGFDLSLINQYVLTAVTTGVDQFPNIPAALQGHASVQCENCHGPGSEHLGNIQESHHGIAGVNLNPEQCAQCHDSASGFQQGFYQWNLSSHPVTADASEGRVSTSTGCVKCHTGEGFVQVYVDGKAPTSHPNANGITCSTCHDPHNSDNEHQIRLAGAYKFDSGQTYEDPGLGGLCIRCHSARISNPVTTATTSSRGSHYGTAGDIMAGINAVDMGLAVQGNSAHSTIVGDTCVTCHMAKAPVAGPGITTAPAVGEHTYAMRDENGTHADTSDDILNAQNACGTCHASIGSDYNVIARGDYDGDGTLEGVQSEMEGLHTLLRTRILSTWTGAALDNHGKITVPTATFNGLTADQKYALYNYNFFWVDGSLGVHNTSYAVQMLQRSYFGVFGHSILDDFPGIDLRGPVQPPTVAVVPTPVATPIPIPSATPSTPARIEIRAASPREVALDPADALDEVSSGLSAVAVGTKMYLEAVDNATGITGYEWSIASAPVGSSAQLASTTGASTTFRPDVNGRYVLRLHAETGTVTTDAEKTVYAGQWVGVGIFDTHDTSAPRAPECATGFCHGGSNADPTLAVVGEWIQSNHAQKLQMHLAGERGVEYDESCLACHTLGFNTNAAAANGGFDDIATALSYNLAQIPALIADAVANDVDHWTDLPGGLQGHASVQCESCHGSGTQHPVYLAAGDKGIDGVNLDTKQCAQCHDSLRPSEQGFYQWSQSTHPITADLSEGHVVDNASCVKCHTGEGFIDVFVNKNTARIRPDNSSVTCSTCHDPHFSENPHQLRIAGDHKLDSGHQSFGAGTGGLCFRCHNSRMSNAENTALTSTRGSHYGPQADMLMGANGVSFSLAFSPNSAHTSVVPDSCVTCHMADPTSSVGQPDAVHGGHTFSLRDDKGTADPSDDVTNQATACGTCHQQIASLDYPADGDYDGDGVVEGTQTEVQGLFDILRPRILSSMAGTSINAGSGKIDVTSGGFAALTPDQKKALYNYNFVWLDGSLGVHNTSYAVQLLQRSYFGITGRPIDQDFPGMTLRGPVQSALQITQPGIWLR